MTRFRLIMNCGNCRYARFYNDTTGYCSYSWKMATSKTIKEYTQCCRHYEYKGKGEPMAM